MKPMRITSSSTKYQYDSLNLVDRLEAEVADVATVEIVGVLVERASVRVAHAPRADFSEAT